MRKRGGHRENERERHRVNESGSDIERMRERDIE
jgi:hypothetical protein